MNDPFTTPACHTATILIYEHDGRGYEIAHLGALLPDRWGCFAVYSAGGEMLGEFNVPGAPRSVPGFSPPRCRCPTTS